MNGFVPDTASQTGVTVKRLKIRADFLKARHGARSHHSAFVLQLRQRHESDLPNGDNILRVGYTVTKKVGNAVERNRIKRRFRAAVTAADLPRSCAGKDAVLIARREALSVPFKKLVAGINHGLTHAKISNNKRDVAIQALAGQKRRGDAKASQSEAV